MAKENIKALCLRFDLADEDDRRAYELLQNRDKVEFGSIPDDAIIESVLRFGTAEIAQKYLQIIKTAATEYVAGIFRKLREHEYNPDLMKLYVVGGGGCMIKNFGQYDPKRVIIKDDICATAKGYEYMAKQKLQRNGGKL